MTFTVATWNVNSLRVRLPHLTEWLDANAAIDVVALQETKLADADFPGPELYERGWHSVFSGQRTYNGVAILSRVAATDVVAGIPGFDDEQKRVLAVTVGDVRVIDVYVPNGQAPGTDKFAYKLRWLEALRQYVLDELTRHPRLVSSATSTSRPKIAMCTIRRHGRARSTSAHRSAQRCSPSCTSAWPIASGCSTSRKRPFRGGTTGCWRSVATRACASTWCSPPPRSLEIVPLVTSTRHHAGSNGRPTTLRSSPRLTYERPARAANRRPGRCRFI
jgi:hypothetical protein